MNKFRFTLMALAIMAFTLMISSSAQAQATRTWVSGVGDDANPCSRTAPCKTFAGAISKTADCGEIDALDPGVDVTETVTAGGSSLSFSGDQYNYTWKTESSWAGTCRQLVVTLNDGSVHTANFKFK